MHLVHHSSVEDISDLICISGKTVRRYIQKFRQLGDVVPQHQRSGPRSLFGDYERVVLLRLILDRPGIYSICTR